MGPTGERPPELPAPQRAGGAVRLEAHASGEARVNQAARDLHLHYQDGVRGARRVEPGSGAQECPYPGLAAFGSEQARWFFGRDQLISELIARLDARLRTGGVQVVVAPSGAGKSSLLHAGLLPKLGDGVLPGSSQWPTAVFTPTAQPLQTLAAPIADLTGTDPVSLAEQFVAASQRAGSMPRGCIRVGGPGTRLVMVVDQFEELFTLCTDDRQRRTFIELLAQIVDPPSAAGPDPHPVGLVVVGVRADFYAACVNYPHLRTALQDGPLVVGPMSDAELRAAILYPAQEVGLDVEPGLVELLLRDLGDTAAAAGEDGTALYEAGRLPLLAHALRATWQQRHGHILTVNGYRATGGIQRAVATTADRVFTVLSPASQHAARILFLRLIRIGDGTEDTRRRMARDDLLEGLDPGSTLTVLEEFTRARLLTQDQDTVEITHEALLRAWPRLRQWIDTDRAGNLIRQELDEATAVWDRNRRDAAALYRGSRLETARTWAAATPHQGDLGPAASAFLAASTRQERRATRLRHTVLIVLSILALVASGAAVVAIQQTSTAQRERDTAVLNQITLQADRLRSTDVSLAAQLDLVAYRMRRTSGLYTALVSDANAALSTPLTGHSESVWAVASSPDGRTLASASEFDGTVRLWDVTDRTHPAPLGPPLTGHTGFVRAVAFSPDGRTLVSSGGDGTVLWDVTDRARPVPLGPPLTDHTGAEVTSAVLSPDGRTLASGHVDGTVRLLNIIDPARPTPVGPPLTGHTGIVDAVAFSPDGHTLVSSGGDGTLRRWNVTDPARPTPVGIPLTGDTGFVNAMAFSPDGRTLATASLDQTVRLWNVTDPARPAPLGPPLTGHTGSVRAVVFSPDGRTLASSSDDGTLRLWNIPSGLTGRTSVVQAVAFSPDGRTLASGHVDGTIQLWNVTDTARPTPVGSPLIGDTGVVTAVAFSPDGRTLASGGGSGSHDGTARLWNVTDPAHPAPLGPPLIDQTGSVGSLAFSLDGRTLAGVDRTVRLWNVTDPARPAPLGPPLTGHANAAFAVAFSPDGRTLASAGDETVRLWNVTDPAHPVPVGPPLTGHSSSVLSVAFSPDGHTLASAGDETVWLWNVTDPAHATPMGPPLTGHTELVLSVAFSPDGRTLASSGNDQTVRFWEMNVDQAIRRICDTTANTLTPEKWERYVSSDLPYRPPCR